MIEIIIVGAVIGLFGYLAWRSYKDDKPSVAPVEDTYVYTPVTPTPADEKAVELTEEEFERTRDALGRFLPDDGTTPDVNEAWVGGVSPAKSNKVEVVDAVVTVDPSTIDVVPTADIASIVEPKPKGRKAKVIKNPTTNKEANTGKKTPNMKVLKKKKK